MNATTVYLLFLALALPQSVSAAPPHKQASSHPSPAAMTREQGFYYWIAVYGAPPNVVDRYATIFDADNYKRAMADEFVRNQYRAATQDRISSNVKRLTFDEKYIYVSPIDHNNAAKFGEYSFATHSFPVIEPNTGFSYFNYWVAGNGFDVNPFSLEMALNAKDFSWSLPMPEGQARALLQAHPSRQLTLRIVYSVTKRKKDVHSQRYYLTPFIHSIEVFADSTTTTPIGKLARDATTPGSWRDANTLVSGQETVFYQDRYSAYWGTDGLAPSKSGELPSKEGAKYYRIIDHHERMIFVKDYYITGELEMEGQYQPSCATKKQCPDGSFVWYHKNGYKRQEETFVDGEESPYCVEAYVAQYARMWDEDGKCKRQSTKKCPCADQASARVGPVSEIDAGAEQGAAGQRVSGQPAIETRVEAQYTEVARKAGVQGIVIVKCSIDERGNVVSTEVLKALPFGLDAAAVTAVRQWKFRPAEKEGQPVPSSYNATVTFTLDGNR